MNRGRAVGAWLACVALGVMLQFPAGPAKENPGAGGLPAGVDAVLGPEAKDLWARALGQAARNPAPAVLVSRHQFTRLRPFRSWQDLERLRIYVQWADRAEAAGFDGGGIAADVSGFDLILLREPCGRYAVTPPARLLCDPLGQAVIDPGPQAAGWVKLPLIKKTAARAVAPALPAGLPTEPLPVIQAAVVAGGNVVEIYGEFGGDGPVRVLSRGGEGRILYAGPSQINAELPSVDEVQVERNGLASEWTAVQERGRP